VPTGKLLPLAMPVVCAVLAPEQLSVPTGAVYVTGAAHWPEAALAVMSSGQEIAEGWSSDTVTVNVQEAVWLLAAVTTKVLVVMPTGKLLPLAMPVVCAVLAPEQLSVPTGAVYVTGAAHCPEAALAVMSAGQEIIGGWLSDTVTVNAQEAVWLLAAVTTKVLVVMPTGKLLPLAMPVVRAVLAPEQLSVPTGAVYVTGAAHWPEAALAVMSAGQEIIGGLTSSSVTVKAQAPVLLASSVAVKVTVWLPRPSVAPTFGDCVIVLFPQPPFTVANPV